MYENQQASITHFLGTDTGEQAKINQQAMEAMRPYLNLIYLVVIPFLSFVSWKFFRKKDLNYAEHLVANAFLLGGITVLGFFTMGFYYFFPSYMTISVAFGGVIYTVFFTYGYKRLFQISVLEAFIKSLFGYIFGYLLMMLAIFLISIIVVIIILILKKTGLV